MQKIFKICKKYLNHHQYSVFRGEITPSKLLSLTKEIKKTIDPEEDHVTILKFLSSSYFEEETLGDKSKNGDNLFI